MIDESLTIRVEVQGSNPDELIAAAVAHAVRFFPALPPTAFEVDLGVVEPATWNPGGQVARWRADAEVRPRPPTPSGGRCTCGERS